MMRVRIVESLGAFLQACHELLGELNMLAQRVYAGVILVDGALPCFNAEPKNAADQLMLLGVLNAALVILASRSALYSTTLAITNSITSRSYISRTPSPAPLYAVNAISSPLMTVTS